MTRLFIVFILLFSLTCKGSKKVPFQAYIAKKEGIPFYIENGKNLNKIANIPYAAEITVLAVEMKMKDRNKDPGQWEKLKSTGKEAWQKAKEQLSFKPIDTDKYPGKWDRVRFLKTEGWIQSEKGSTAKKKPQTTLKFASSKIDRKLLYVLREGERIIESEYSFAMNRDIDKFAILVKDKYDQSYLIRNSERVSYGDSSDTFRKVLYKGDTFIDVRSYRVEKGYSGIRESIYVNGKSYGPEKYLDWTYVVLSEDGAIWGYQGGYEDGRHMYINGKRVKPDSPSVIQLYGKNMDEYANEYDKKEAEILEKKDGDYIKYKKKEFGPFYKVKKLVEPKNTKSFVALAIKKEKEKLEIDLPDQLKKEKTQIFVVTQKKKYGPYTTSSKYSEALYVSPKSKKWVLSYYDKENKLLIVNGKKYGPYFSLNRDPVFSKNEESWATIVMNKKDKQRLLVNGKEIPIKYDGDLDGKNHQLAISNSGKEYAVLIDKGSSYILYTDKKKYGPFTYSNSYIDSEDLKIEFHEKHKVWYIQYPTGTIYFVKDKDIISNRVIRFFKDRERVYKVKDYSSYSGFNSGPKFAGIEEYEGSYYANILGKKYGNSDAFFIDRIQIDGATHYVWFTLEGRAIYGHKLKESDI
ncbi:MAG: hypothetical protein AAF518_21265 [Spirochaetota bacterium]